MFRHAVDSQQPAADVVSDGEPVYVLFVDTDERSTYRTRSRYGWQNSVLQVDDILGSWVLACAVVRMGSRATDWSMTSALTGRDGMNSFAEIVLGVGG